MSRHLLTRTFRTSPSSSLHPLTIPTRSRQPISRRCLQTGFPSQSPNSTSRRVLIQAALVTGLGVAIYNNYHHLLISKLYAEAPPAPVEVEVERRRKTAGLSNEENREVISSQHLQVKKSWENPGLYAWGLNSGRVAAPDSDENVVKTPRRIAFFDGLLLRDVKLDRYFGAAVTEKGDLVQWGTGYSADIREPTATLKGKNLVSVSLSQDRILALSSSGKVYSVPISQEDQKNGPKLRESTWIPFWSSRADISYRVLTPLNLGWGEKVTSLTSGLDSALLLTSTGRLFSAASSTSDFPSHGETGVPGLTQATNVGGAYDRPHEITTLKGFNIVAIAQGDYHSLALDKDGRVFASGDNQAGQLGIPPSNESPCIDAPSLLAISSLYAGTGLSPRVTGIAAGGQNSFFTIDATRIAQPGEEVPSHQLGRVTADTWSCGQGILGQLANGRWTHTQGTPVKIKTLSGLYEWDESNHCAIPIRLKSLAIGSTHAAAIMDNVTSVTAGQTKDADSRNDTNWGADVVWWGHNEFYQLGMGKRNNLPTPAYIAPLDTVAERERAKRREEHRFQITPRHEAKIGGGRRVSVEQRIECGRMCSAVYSGV